MSKKKTCPHCSDLARRVRDLEDRVDREQTWHSWQKNASNTGGQFGFGSVRHPLGDVQA